MRLQERGGGEHRLVGEAHVTADRADRVDLQPEVRAAARGILGHLALDIVIRPQPTYRRRGGGLAIDRYEVDARERRERLGALLTRVGGPPFALVDVCVGRLRRHESVSRGPWRLEMPDVSDLLHGEAL